MVTIINTKFYVWPECNQVSVRLEEERMSDISRTAGRCAAPVAVARFDALESLRTGFPDLAVDGCRRATLPICGFRYPPAAAGDRAGLHPPITEATAIAEETGISICYVTARPGQGCLMHIHDVTEVLTVLRGTWRVEWLDGSGAPQARELGPFDTAAVPAGLPRRFECLSAPQDDADAMLMATVVADAPIPRFTPEAAARIKKASSG